MNYKIFTLFFATIFFTSIANAKIFRVGYTGLPLAGVDYTIAQSQQAQDDASAGDTIQIYGNSINMTIDKQLVIIGFGYNFDVNPNLQAIGTDQPSNVNLFLNTGSGGTIVSGVSGNFVISATANATDGISDITFQRGNGAFNLYNYISYGPISNIKIISCVAQNIFRSFRGVDAKPITNFQIFNSILTGVTLEGVGTSATIVNCVSEVLQAR